MQLETELHASACTTRRWTARLSTNFLIQVLVMLRAVAGDSPQVTQAQKLQDFITHPPISLEAVFDVFPFCYAWLIEQIAFHVGEWQSVQQIRIEERRIAPLIQ